MSPVLGVIADDFTGATDLASSLVRGGLRTVQVIGAPDGPAPDADAVVVALKTRTAPVAEAVRESLAAWKWLRAAGARQAYFKVCSTFDSTPQGNIGPVAEALLDALGPGLNLVCPALPENGRTVYRGHLFVGDQLLSDTGMREHPLTPMNDANLVRVMQAQCRRPVGLLRHDLVAQGVAAVRGRLAQLQAEGVVHVVADAINDAALRVLAEVGSDLRLLTAGSGLALGLPDLYARRGWAQLDPCSAQLAPMSGPAALLAGSCSQATQAQVARWRDAGGAAFSIDPQALAGGEPTVANALAWARERLVNEPVLIYSSTDAQTLKAVQNNLGRVRAGALVEQAMAQLAQGLVQAGVQRLVVAGGETSGAVVQALSVRTLRIGQAICPGVPWTQADGRSLWLALKSGNFGDSEFFAEALRASQASP